MYAASKLMLYMFGVELQKRLRSSGSSTDIFSAHPGVAQTDAFRKSDKSKLMARIMASGADAIGQSPGGGAQSLVRCATDPALTGKHAHISCEPASLCTKLATWDSRNLYALVVDSSLCIGCANVLLVLAATHGTQQ